MLPASCAVPGRQGPPLAFAGMALGRRWPPGGRGGTTVMPPHVAEGSGNSHAAGSCDGPRTCSRQAERPAYPATCAQHGGHNVAVGESPSGS